MIQLKYWKMHSPLGKYTPPATIDPNTLPPTTIAAERRYPDSNEWRQAHDDEMVQLYAQKAIDWLAPESIKDEDKPLLLKRTCKYKHAADG